MLTIRIATGNAAFCDDTDGDLNDYFKKKECIRILKDVIRKLDSGYDYGACIDINGNKVGEWDLD